MQNVSEYPKIKKGLKLGKTSVILAGVHGNEKCGLKAFDKIISDLKIEAGTVIFDVGNPKAIKKNKRFLELNLNRAFQKKKAFSKKERGAYEYARAQELKLKLNKADALLDIHSSKNIGSKRFVICEASNFSVAKQLPFRLCVTNFDKFEPGSTDFFMNQQKKIALCIECGQHNDPHAAKVAEKSIKNFLIAMNHIPGKNKENPQKKLKISYLYKNENKNFTLVKEFKDFEKIRKGTLIGFDGKTKVISPYSCKILFAHTIKGKIRQECFLLARDID